MIPLTYYYLAVATMSRNFLLCKSILRRVSSHVGAVLPLLQAELKAHQTVSLEISVCYSGVPFRAIVTATMVSGGVCEYYSNFVLENGREFGNSKSSVIFGEEGELGEYCNSIHVSSNICSAVSPFI